MLCRAALECPPKPTWGCYHCSSPRCSLHPFLKEGTEIISTKNGRSFPVHGSLSCCSPSVIYVITCKRCNVQGVGETSAPHSRPKVYLNAALGLALPARSTKIEQHLAEPGHTVDDVEIMFVDGISEDCLGRPALYSTMRLDLESKWSFCLNAQLNSRKRRHRSFLLGPAHARRPFVPPR